jgi:hypothetical protein
MRDYTAYEEIIDQYQSAAVKDVRTEGRYFREIIEAMQAHDEENKKLYWKDRHPFQINFPLLLESLDALESRVEALESNV